MTPDTYITSRRIGVGGQIISRVVWRNGRAGNGKINIQASVQKGWRKEGRNV